MNQLDHDPALQAAFYEKSTDKPAPQLGEPVSREDWLAGVTGRGFLAACKAHPYWVAFAVGVTLLALWLLVRAVSPEAALTVNSPAPTSNEQQSTGDEIAYAPVAAGKNKQPQRKAVNTAAPTQPAFQGYQSISPAPEPTPGVPTAAALQAPENPKLLIPLTPRQQAYEDRQAARSRSLTHSFNQEK